MSVWSFFGAFENEIGSSTLLEMSNHKPITEEDMLKISGVGERKMSTYGVPFLELVTEYVMASFDDQGVGPDWLE